MTIIHKKKVESLHCDSTFSILLTKNLFRNYYLGISLIGILVFVIQEIPYIIMPFIKPASNPIMNMQNEIQWIEKVQGLVGVLSMFLLMI